MQFKPISREDIPKTSTREGSVSSALFREFLDSDAEVAQIATDGEEKSLASIRSTLSNYVDRHDLPVNVFTRSGNLYIERLTPVAHAELKAKRERIRAARQAQQAAGENAVDSEVDEG